MRQNTGFLKTLLKTSKTSQNLLQRNRCQMSVACHWETSLSRCNVYGPMKCINVDNENYSDELARALHVESVSQDIHATNWVTISGTEYRPGLIICSQIDDEMPVFLRIEKNICY